MALVSFKLLLATRRLSIFSPEVVVFTDPFLSILGMYMTAVISDAAFLTVKVCQGRYQSYNCPRLHTILLFSKMNWVRCNDRFNLGSVVEHN